MPGVSLSLARESNELFGSTAAVWTPVGRGAVATVRVAFRSATQRQPQRWPFRAASGCVLDEEWPIGQVSFGQWGASPSEDVVLCRTGDLSFEVHCHGGMAAVRRIVSDLEAAGCHNIEWPTQSKLEAGLLHAEFSTALSNAKTLRAAAWILAQRGRMEDFAQRLDSQIRSGDWTSASRDVQAASRWSNFGLHLSQPWSVVLAGRPNVGKSSLINALVGFERSIVFDQPGTTRDVVTADTVLDGWPVRLSDTAGQRTSVDQLESAGISVARQAMLDADCLILVFDVHEPPTEDDYRLLAEWPHALVVAHKSDLPGVWGESLPTHALRVSSRERTGLDVLAAAIVAALVPELPPHNAVVPLTWRQAQGLRAISSAVQARDSLAAVQAIHELLAR